MTDKGVTILVDRKATLFLIGTTMDYEVKPLSAGFTFVNPNEKGRCGCGEVSTSSAVSPAAPAAVSPQRRGRR